SDLTPNLVDAVSHATTIATNAILERKGAKVAVVTTKGFRDILIIGRQKRHDTYNLHLDKSKPLVERHSVYEVSERVASDGEVIEQVDLRELESLAQLLRNEEYQAVALCFINSYANAANEEYVAEELARLLPNVLITASYRVSPKIREYERTSTVVANAYVAPAMNDYISKLRSSLVELNFPDCLQVMQSNGGLISPELACAYPIRVVESGPAAGVLMCATIGKSEGFE